VQEKLRHNEIGAPSRVGTFLGLHLDFIPTRNGVSYNLFSTLADYIEQKQSNVQLVVLNEISKSVQRPYELTT
jgi:hypothetical protein